MTSAEPPELIPTTPLGASAGPHGIHARRARSVRVLCTLLLAVLPGCFAARSTFNEPLRRERLAYLRPGETTAREVVTAFGAPAEVVQLARRSAYRYEFTVTKRAGLVLFVAFLLNEDTRADRVWVFFDENDILSHVGATFDSDQTEYAMPWEDVHQPEETRQAREDSGQ